MMTATFFQKQALSSILQKAFERMFVISQAKFMLANHATSKKELSLVLTLTSCILIWLLRPDGSPHICYRITTNYL